MNVDGKNIRPRLVTREGEEDDHGGEAQGVRYQGGDDDELCELFRGPCPLEVAAALVQGQDGDGEGEDVALDKSGGQEGPWVYER